MRKGRGKQGRRVLTRYSDEDRKRLTKKHARSGLTKKAFCEREGINLGTFQGWTRYDRTAKRKPRMAEVSVAAPTPPVVEVQLPNGACIAIRHQGEREELVERARGLAGC